MLFTKDSLLKLFTAGTFTVMTLSVYICGDTKNVVCHAGHFRAQAIRGIEIVAGGVSLEARHVANDHRLLEGWVEDDTSHHYQPCMLALLSLAQINVHVIKSQEDRFVICDVLPVCCAVLGGVS